MSELHEGVGGQGTVHAVKRTARPRLDEWDRLAETIGKW